MAIKRLKEVRSTDQGLVGILPRGEEVPLSEPKQFMLSRSSMDLRYVGGPIFPISLHDEVLDSMFEGDDIYAEFGPHTRIGREADEVLVISYNCYAERGKDISLLTSCKYDRRLPPNEVQLLKWEEPNS